MIKNKLYKENKKLYKDERTFCLSFNDVDFINLAEEFTPAMNSKNIRKWEMFDKKGKYIERAIAEGNPAFSQIIPYIIILNLEGKILTCTNKNNNKISIGFSSHITPEIGGNRSILLNACIDIVNSTFGELPLSSPLTMEGFIKTYTKETTGHIGLMCTLPICANKSDIQDTKNFKYEFLSPTDIFERYGRLEGWSKIALGKFL